MEHKLFSVILLSVLWQVVSGLGNTTSKTRWCGSEEPKCIDASKIKCDRHYKYRTYDGSCNNPYNPTLGMALTVYKRLLPSDYGDGIYSMPVSRHDGSPLPSSRRISYQVFGRDTIGDPRLTLLTMQWGQIITHDASIRMPDGLPELKPLEVKQQRCCSTIGRYEIRSSTTPCFPIPVPKNDPFFTNRHCIDFDRSITDKDQKCPGTANPTPAEQLNGVTHYLDLSLVYGSSIKQNRILREFTGGFLLTHDHKQKWPPRALNAAFNCELGNPGNLCYEFGDIRGNQNPGLTSLQIIFLREHNRIATELAWINKHWDDETLFQEARRINIAQYQYITFYEWNIPFYGAERLYREELIFKTRHGEYINDYDPCVDPRSIQSFMQSSFRYFHNQIMGQLHLVTESRKLKDEILTLNQFVDRPGILEEHREFKSMIRGLSTQSSALVDSNFDIEAAENFILGSGLRGRDLRAFDIQRDRDHGLPRYNEFRAYCGLKRARRWRDYSDYISEEDIRLLQRIYKSYEDVDLSVGGALEFKEPDSLVGPTFLCINIIQFRNMRSGDRFFFENEDQPHPFTRDQLTEIRRASVARLLCDNANVDQMQPNAFRSISRRNPLLPCSKLPSVDLRKWRERR